jgi:hypothetical protein
MVFGLFRALPGVPGFLATIARRIITRGLDPSVGRSGPHVFAVRIGVARLAAPTRPSHPEPNVRDDRDTPLWRSGMQADNHIFLKNGSRIFFAQGLDANSENQFDGQITFS